MRTRLLASAAAVAVLAMSLGGCAFGVSMGLTPQQNEDGYTAAATIADSQLNAGNAAGLCGFDKANYDGLVSNRNALDGVKSYEPADNAHAKLQADGVPLSDKCVAVPSS